MAFVFFEYSCVLLAQSHNPTIVNPDWLRNVGIVSTDWNWELSEPPIITQPFARVAYDSGVELVAQTEKIIVKGPSPDKPFSEYVSTIASRYVEILEHIPYSAVGHNFKAGIPVDDASASILYLLGSRVEFSGRADTGGVKLVYNDVNSARLIISIDAGTAEVTPEDGAEPVTKEMLIVTANYHHAASSSESCLEAIQLIDSHKDNFFELLKNIQTGIESV